MSAPAIDAALVVEIAHFVMYRQLPDSRLVRGVLDRVGTVNYPGIIGAVVHALEECGPYAPVDGGVAPRQTQSTPVPAAAAPEVPVAEPAPSREVVDQMQTIENKAAVKEKRAARVITTAKRFQVFGDGQAGEVLLAWCESRGLHVAADGVVRCYLNLAQVSDVAAEVNRQLGAAPGGLRITPEF